MHIFNKLRILRAFEKRHLPFLETVEDHDVVREIGYHQERDSRLTLKQLYVLKIGSAATIQRRLSRLKRLGVVHHRRARDDGRSVELSVSPELRRIYRRIGLLLAHS